MFGVVPKSIWQRIYPADENNLCNWAMRCLLVDTGKQRILIDTGIGEKQTEKFFSHYHLNGDVSLISSLVQCGYQPEDITDVIQTHLHFDHCGGTIQLDANNQLIPTFPDADLWVSKEQWQLAVNPNNRESASMLKENILPMKDSGKLKLIESEGELFPDIYVYLFNGHTEGQVIPRIRVNDKYLIFGGDLFPSAAHIPYPYIMGYDMCAKQTLNDKERFFQDAMLYDYTIFFEHDLYTECSTIQQTPKGFKADKKFSLSEFIEWNCKIV